MQLIMSDDVKSIDRVSRARPTNKELRGACGPGWLPTELLRSSCLGAAACKREVRPENTRGSHGAALPPQLLLKANGGVSPTHRSRWVAAAALWTQRRS